MRNLKRLLAGTAITVLLALSGAGVHNATAAVPCVLPAGNTAQQWDEIAQKAVLSVVTFQNESFIYLAYANGAAYRAVFSSPLSFLGSPDAAIATAEFDVLTFHFPAQSELLQCYRDASLGTAWDTTGIGITSTKPPIPFYAGSGNTQVSIDAGPRSSAIARVARRRSSSPACRDRRRESPRPRNPFRGGRGSWW